MVTYTDRGAPVKRFRAPLAGSSHAAAAMLGLRKATGSLL